MAKMGKYECANPRCRVWFEARTADRARGYARSCSKACASVVRMIDKGGQKMFEPKRDGFEEYQIEREICGAS